MQKQLLQMINKMDKNELESGLQRITSCLNEDEKKNLLKTLNNMKKEN